PAVSRQMTTKRPFPGTSTRQALPITGTGSRRARSSPFPPSPRLPTVRTSRSQIMKTLTIGLSLAALALAGTAHAAPDASARPDRDRTVTRAEAQTRASQVFARLDVNKDGKIDAGDRQARAAARFDKLDANKDGQLSRDEFTARQARADRGERAERGE